MTIPLTRAAIVAEARTWIGTRYRHQGSLKGVGCDCLGLVRGVWRNCVGSEPEMPPPYAPDWAEASGAETLAEAALRHLVPVTRDEIVWSYAGVRPLDDDGASAAQEATRDYVIRTEAEPGAALVNVFGGKLTTSRRLGEEVVDGFAKLIGARGKRWTRKAKLPGGEFETTGFEAEAGRLQRDYPGLDAALVRRLARLYGTRATIVLGAARQPAELGEHFGWNLHAREVDYLMAEEWARTADDVLWRRTKAGLRVTAEDKARLAAYMAARLG